MTNLTAETLTLTATDASDGIVVQEKPTMEFVVPAATSASIGANPMTVTANGVATSTITITLKDGLNRATPGKEVTVSQGNGHSSIIGPSPSVTDAAGQIQFTVTDLVNETVTYTALDLTDGNLAVPGSASVVFDSGSGSACGQNVTPPTGLNGYRGANPRFQMERTDASGSAVLDLTGAAMGSDVIVAKADLSGAALISNQAKVTWTAGKHTSFLTLNPSPKGGSPGGPITVEAALTDTSLDPTMPLSGVTITFDLDGSQCSDTTDANGRASCQVTPPAAGLTMLLTSFDGTAELHWWTRSFSLF